MSTRAKNITLMLSVNVRIFSNIYKLYNTSWRKVVERNINKFEI